MPQQNIPYAAIRHYRPNWLLRKLRFRERGRGEFEFAWGSINWHTIGFEFLLHQFSDEDLDGERYPWCLSFVFGWIRFWITLPIPVKGHTPKRDGDEIRSYGMQWHLTGRDPNPGEIELSFGRFHDNYYLPWNVVYIETRVMTKYGTWETVDGSLQRPAELRESDTAYESYPFYWLSRRGELQTVQAKIKVCERETRYRLLRNRSFGRILSYYIQIDFDPPLKGGGRDNGLVSSAQDLRYDETPHECLMRLQKTHVMS